MIGKAFENGCKQWWKTRTRYKREYDTQLLKFNQFTLSFSILPSGGIDIDSGTSELADIEKADKCKVNG